MSTLTKLLIVLLTVFSIILCAVSVTYVVNTENFKEKYTKTANELQTAQENQDAAEKKAAETLQKCNDFETSMKQQIAQYQTQINELTTKLENAEREKSSLVAKVDGFAAKVEQFITTNKQQSDLLSKKIEELKQVEIKAIQLDKDLEETSQALLQKLAVIEDMKIERERLLDQQSDLEVKLAKFLQGKGREVAIPTQVQQPAPTVAVATRDINLKGLVKAVDVKNSSAVISLGTADGVRKNMIFFVTRGNQFICQITIMEVDSEEAVGTLQLIQQTPQIGDSVATNL